MTPSHKLCDVSHKSCGTALCAGVSLDFAKGAHLAECLRYNKVGRKDDEEL